MLTQPFFKNIYNLQIQEGCDWVSLLSVAIHLIEKAVVSEWMPLNANLHADCTDTPFFLCNLKKTKRPSRLKLFRKSLNRLNKVHFKSFFLKFLEKKAAPSSLLLLYSEISAHQRTYY